MKPTLKPTATITALVLLIAVHCAFAQTEAVSVKAQPASVVKTIPAAGDTTVDPALKEITVTFSKDMKTNRMWSICQISKESFPESAGQVHYLNNRTCVMPVKLEPGKTYVLWFNRAQFNSFRDVDNHPSVPYLLVFETRK
jgi:RNA polymerase sigma-70 factor (ECF subfamily)